MDKNIISLYDKYKNTPKKLKIICDWDEVIQACEPYALYLALKQNPKLKNEFDFTFEEFSKKFWQKDFPSPIIYSPYGTKLYTPKDSEEWNDNLEEVAEKQQAIKNSPNFYQEAPFLTIVEDLLKLIKEDKVKKLIFLSAYDKRKFPDETDKDIRKEKIFRDTFGKIFELKAEIELWLLGFDSETQGQTKADWIKQNAADFDIVIDDNPNICEDILTAIWPCDECAKSENEENCKTGRCDREIKATVLTPHYPDTANQHHQNVVLIKQEVSKLKKEDFRVNKYE